MLQDHNAFRLAISASLSDWSLTGSDIDTTGSRKLTSGILLIEEVLMPNNHSYFGQKSQPIDCLQILHTWDTLDWDHRAGPALLQVIFLSCNIVNITFWSLMNGDCQILKFYDV